MRTSREDCQKYGLNRWSLEFIGIWPSKQEHKNALLRQLRIPFTVFSIMICNIAPHMYALSRVSRELPLLSDNLLATIFMLTAIVKILVIWNNRSQLKALIEKVRKDWNESRSLLWNERVMVKQAGRARIFFIAGYSIMLLSIVGLMTTPFFGISIRVINNITDPYGNARFFPLQIAYPFDAFSTPRFEFLYFTQSASVTLVGFLFSLPDYFFSSLTFHASAQYQILSQKFGLLFPKDLQFVERLILDGGRTFRSKLRQFHLQHVNLIRFVALIENVFNMLILSHVVGMGSIICLLGFIIATLIRSNSGSVPIPQVIVLVLSMLALLIQVFVYCFTSEILLHYSSGLHEAIYRSEWYLSPAKYSRNIIPVIIRAKIPLQLTAGKFINLSLRSYCSIIKTSAGYVSVLLAASG